MTWAIVSTSLFLAGVVLLSAYGFGVLPQLELYANRVWWLTLVAAFWSMHYWPLPPNWETERAKNLAALQNDGWVVADRIIEDKGKEVFLATKKAGVHELRATIVPDGTLRWQLVHVEMKMGNEWRVIAEQIIARGE